MSGTKHNIILWCVTMTMSTVVKNILLLYGCLFVYVCECFLNKYHEFILLCITITLKNYSLPLTNGGQKFKSPYNIITSNDILYIQRHKIVIIYCFVVL